VKGLNPVGFAPFITLSDQPIGLWRREKVLGTRNTTR